MKIFAVRDKAWLGRGIFALFSTSDKAEQYLRASTGFIRQSGEIAEIALLHCTHMPPEVFAAYTYDSLHDSHVFDGLYGDAAMARDAVGIKGNVVGHVIDIP